MQPSSSKGSETISKRSPYIFMRLDGVKPRSLIFAQFSEGTGPTAGIAATGAGTVSVLRTSTLGEIKQPPLSHLNEKHFGWATTVERRPPQTWFDRDGKLIVHGSPPKMPFMTTTFVP
jgi:hypothetical protein